MSERFFPPGQQGFFATPTPALTGIRWRGPQSITRWALVPTRAITVTRSGSDMVVSYAGTTAVFGEVSGARPASARTGVVNLLFQTKEEVDTVEIWINNLAALEQT